VVYDVMPAINFQKVLFSLNSWQFLLVNEILKIDQFFHHLVTAADK